MAYNEFSNYYDKLMYDCDYDKWSQHFFELLKGCKNGLELGSGSGTMTISLAKHGFNMTGVEKSLEMLAKAYEKSRREGMNIMFLEGDAENFDLGKTFDFVIAPIDVFNYLQDSSLKKAIKSVSAHLKTGGKFIFDISSPYKLTEILGGNTFYEDREELTYIWTNEEKAGKVFLSLIFFVKTKDGNYTRFDENQVFHIHKPDAVKKVLQDNSFSVEIFESLDKIPVAGTSERLFFICEKK